MIGIVFSATDIPVNKTKPLPSWNFYFSGGIINKKIYNMPNGGGGKCYGGKKGKIRVIGRTRQGRGRLVFAYKVRNEGL